ncbi:hypothetical protein E8E13_001245 [Curvularia kusanoi]|uniref:Uncharacterized protein n=1 Tax=Curvularia kusanoi TaxID=90978 RepID=A0A9P4TBM2_CURKU|nr:hypothetical protein E8E13_001245 [Curvularia kusanoi]
MLCLTSSPSSRLKRIIAALHTGRSTPPAQPVNDYASQVSKGRSWLQHNARRMLNHIETSGLFEDNFSQFFIMENTNDISLLHLQPYNDLETDSSIQTLTSTAKRWNYFLRDPVGTTKTFPEDVDTTSYSLLAFTPTSGVHQILDDMLANKTSEGLVQTYWDPTRPRIDFCVQANVVRAFYKYGRGAEVQESLAYVRKALEEEEYLEGTRVYCGPEIFLFFVSQLVGNNPQAPELQALRGPLVEAITARLGVYETEVAATKRDSTQTDQVKTEKESASAAEVDCLAIAMRVLACQSLKVRPE